MKRHGNLFSQICSRENIIDAIFTAAKGKKKRKSVQMVLKNLPKHISIIQEILKTPQNFRPKTATRIKIEQNKRREIEVSPFFPNQVLHHAFMNIIEPLLRPSIHANSFSHIKGRGIDKAIKKSKKYCRAYKYFLKFDIKKFYENIDKEILLGLFARKVKDVKAQILLRALVSHKMPGLPIGSYLSGILANFYLCQLDHALSRHAKFIRYADDIVLWSHSKSKLWEAFRVAEQTLAKLKLKAHKVNLGQPKKQGVDFLGIRMLGHFALLRRRNAEKIKRLAKIKAINPQSFARIFSFFGYLKRANCFNLFSFIFKTTRFGSKTLRQRIKSYTKRANISNPLHGLCFHRPARSLFPTR